MPKRLSYKKFAIGLARQAGKIMREEFRLGMAKQWKPDNTPVTETDLKINRLVIKEVRKYFSGHDLLGEEESYRFNGGKYLWVCDPIDGTIPFSHGIPTCAFSLALTYDGRPILGVIYDPFMNRLLYAEKGKGAFLNGKRVRVNRQNMRQAIVFWGVSALLAPFKKEFETAKGIDFYSYVYAGMLVACGELAGALCLSKYAHDAAAVKIAVEEAGGKVTDVLGKEQRYDQNIRGVLASNGVVHKELLAVIKKNRKLFRFPA